MTIDGIIIESDDKKTLCRIESFSDQLMQIIRDNLTSLAHGNYQAQSIPDFYTYKNTLKEFINRYSSKAEDTQKGMIAELLVHTILPLLFTDLTSLSVLFNKEERSIKKGFDIIYCDLSAESIWYSEVKSGHKPDDKDCDEANIILLNRAYSDILEKFGEGRSSLWLSALIDATLVLEQDKHITVKNLLSADSPLKKDPSTEDKNIILVSVLYETPSNPITLDSLKKILDRIDKDKKFQNSIIFSIQKETFEKVALFLESEMA